MDQILQVLYNIDTNLHYYLEVYGVAIYVLLFLVIYSKTAFIVLTFLPGDTTVFASGTFTAMGELELWVLFVLFITATTLGDSQNFLIGKYVGKMSSKNHFFITHISEEIVAKARNFLTDYGRVAIMFSRFVPLMRTSVPFVAGYTGFAYHSFFSFNLIGGLIWTSVWLGAGFILGNFTWVEEHLFVTLLLVSCTAFIPPLIGFIRKYKKLSHL